MPSYKLIYFNVKGRAEPIRLLFAQAGVEYEDYRLKSGEWTGMKPNMPNETLPVLEIDGKVLSQSQAILRYLAREFKLAGSNNFEWSQGEMVMETIMDIINNELLPLFMEKDEVKKAEMKKKIFEEKVKPKLKLIQNMLVANGGEVFVGKTITVADIELFTATEFQEAVLSEDILKDFPKLAALKSKVGKEPKIAAWLAKRPVTAL